MGDKDLAKKLAPRRNAMGYKDPWMATTVGRQASTGSQTRLVGKRMHEGWSYSAEDGYFPGGGNSVTYVTPGQIDGIAARLAYCSVTDMFSMVWDEARTTDMPAKLTKAVCSTSNANWPHTFVIPKYARMEEYKQYAPANHFHMTWNLPVARLQYWMDLANVLSVTPWSDRPAFISGVDRPRPLLHLIAGGEFSAKKALLR